MSKPTYRHDYSPQVSMLEAAEVARLRGVSAKRLDELVAARRIFFIERDGRPLYPAFFVDPRFNPRDLEAVSMRLGSIPGGSKLQFFLTPRGSLAGRTPLDALSDGQLSAVKATADGFRER
jgi:hypothetical protein